MKRIIIYLTIVFMATVSMSSFAQGGVWNFTWDIGFGAERKSSDGDGP